MQIRAPQGVRFHSGRPKIGWHGLLPAGSLVWSGEDCGVPAYIVAGSLAA